MVTYGTLTPGLWVRIPQSLPYASVPERFNGAALKAVGTKVHGGSNPSARANNLVKESNMDFKELVGIIDGKYIICDDYEQRDIFMDFFRAHGILGDYVMEKEMHTEADRWLYPIYRARDEEIHAMSDGYNVSHFSPEERISFREIAPYLYGEDYVDPYGSISQHTLEGLL